MRAWEIFEDPMPGSSSPAGGDMVTQARGLALDYLTPILADNMATQVSIVQVANMLNRSKLLPLVADREFVMSVLDPKVNNAVLSIQGDIVKLKNADLEQQTSGAGATPQNKGPSSQGSVDQMASSQAGKELKT